MAERTPPEHLQDLMAGYVLGDLTPEEAEELKQLLTVYPEMVEELHQLQDTLATMPYALPEVPLPQRLRSTTLKAAQASSKPNRTKKLGRVRLAWGSIAAVLLLALGLDSYHLRQQLATTQAQVAEQKDLIAMLQEPKTQLVTLKGMEQMSKASGNVVITPGYADAILVLQDLPALPVGQFYQLWAIVNDKKIASGQFRTNSQGKVCVKVPFSPGSGMTRLVVTVEVSPTLTEPNGPMVMTSSL